MTRKQRYQFVIDYFKQHAPDAETELLYDNPYQLLVAVILSAQCTDKRVNLTTPAIFHRYPTAQALAKADFDSLFPLIRSISYPNNKTRHLIGMARMLVEDFNGEIPMTVDQLVKLPGVGRKTANVITSVVDQQPNMAVDTHVFRVAGRIGLTLKATTPLAAEKQLIQHFPKELIHKAHHWLILHGRYVCVARKPKCAICGIRPACKYYQAHPLPEA
ncbi:DNA-(apurinic or apyrimidinic site) lyase /endonuclease III [Arachidicoccus rhizosphaerae]|jgi:endonuclease-3|uniref:Endonuclease III n=1 Tax=Arachidicoccus rhizosphaerae TaxID=551991 RepID=A0A1H4CYI0_9BACT|nr:endonuclease III [Arachidicoccus rhizosphaerae]SEA65269.1 DNA-(apurinic or apyrimidinic site) lyase /endonuclease III [Arachidicoccus rhizosphaerae]